MRNLMILAAVCVMAASGVSMADTIRGIDMEFVAIGNAGNAGDTRTGANPYGCGAVSYDYRIGKYEVTNAQWNAFTAAAGAPTGNPISAYDSSTRWTGDQQPTNNVSWYEAAQFCNYLTSGNKSLGAYQLGTDGSITINRVAALSAYGAAYVIPTEDEWYKAAYFKPNGSGYSIYANGTNTAPVAGVNSNYYSASPYHYDGQPWNFGSGTPEQNGTFDMMGNVWEWNETLFQGSRRGIRGGSYNNIDNVAYLASATRGDIFPYHESDYVGFRVASIVPEPCSLVLLGLGGLALRYRKR